MQRMYTNTIKLGEFSSVDDFADEGYQPVLDKPLAEEGTSAFDAMQLELQQKHDYFHPSFHPDSIYRVFGVREAEILLNDAVIGRLTDHGPHMSYTIHDDRYAIALSVYQAGLYAPAESNTANKQSHIFGLANALEYLHGIHNLQRILQYIRESDLKHYATSPFAPGHKFIDIIGIDIRGMSDSEFKVLVGNHPFGEWLHTAKHFTSMVAQVCGIHALSDESSNPIIQFNTPVEITEDALQPLRKIHNYRKRVYNAYRKRHGFGGEDASLRIESMSIYDDFHLGRCIIERMSIEQAVAYCYTHRMSAFEYADHLSIEPALPQ